MANVLSKIRLKVNDSETDYEIEERSKNLRHKKIIAIGDSYSLGVVTRQGEREITNNGWVHYLRSEHEATVYNYGARGAGFLREGVAGPDAGLTFENMIDKAIREHASDRYDIKYVIIGGGSGNDVSELTEDDFGRLRTIMTNSILSLREQFPNAVVWVFPLGGTNVSVSPMRVKSAIAYCENAQNAGACANLGARSWFIGRQEYNGGDAVHINIEGYKLEARYMVETMMGSPVFNMAATIETNPNALASTDSSYFKCYREGTVLRIVGRVRVQFTEDGAHERDWVFKIPEFARKASSMYDSIVLYNITKSYMASPVVVQIEANTGEVSMWHVSQAFTAAGGTYTRGDELYMHLNMAIPIY